MRPKKTRWVKCLPQERCFRPEGVPLIRQESVYLSIDEFEAVRLACLDGLKQEEAARLMRISRPTFSRIITSAHKKIANALVNIKALKIEGGCCRVLNRKEPERERKEGDNA